MAAGVDKSKEWSGGAGYRGWSELNKTNENERRAQLSHSKFELNHGSIE